MVTSRHHPVSKSRPPVPLVTLSLMFLVSVVSAQDTCRMAPQSRSSYCGTLFLGYALDAPKDFSCFMHICIYTVTSATLVTIWCMHANAGLPLELANFQVINDQQCNTIKRVTLLRMLVSHLNFNGSTCRDITPALVT